MHVLAIITTSVGVPCSGWVNLKTWLFPRTILHPVLSSIGSVRIWPLTNVWLSSNEEIVTTPLGRDKEETRRKIQTAI